MRIFNFLKIAMSVRKEKEKKRERGFVANNLETWMKIKLENVGRFQMKMAQSSTTSMTIHDLHHLHFFDQLGMQVLKMYKSGDPLKMKCVRSKRRIRAFKFQTQATKDSVLFTDWRCSFKGGRTSSRTSSIFCSTVTEEEDHSI
ncbi:hypothetical protein Dimus_038948 [Dionaea muscipula]